MTIIASLMTFTKGCYGSIKASCISHVKVSTENSKGRFPWSGWSMKKEPCNDVDFI